MKNLVSIIMPSYNTADFIGESIKSVLSQTYENWELIIVDDCSTDRTDEVVKQYLKDSRIKYLKNTNNLGAALSRNKALRKAEGDWIAFLDSDDLWEPNKLKVQLDFMIKNEYFFSYTEYEEINEFGHRCGVIVSGPNRLTQKDFYNYCYPGCLTVMYNMKKIGLIEIRDIKKNNDYAMWLKICQQSDCYLLKKKLAQYRRRTGSISRHSIITMIGWHYKLWHENIGKNWFISCFYTCCNLFYGFLKKIKYVHRI